MNTYTPDTWKIIRITPPSGETVDKVFAGWYGNFTNGNLWKLNSGNEFINEFDDRYEFKGFSGSVYICYKSREKLSIYQHQVFSGWLLDIKDLNTSMEIIDYEQN